MLPCTPQLPAQLSHPPLIQRLQNSNQTKSPKSQGWQEWHSRRQYSAHSRGVEGGREGSWGHVSQLWSSQDCKSSNSPTACWACMGEVTGGQAQQPADFFSTSSPFSLLLLPFPSWLFPFSEGSPRAWHHTCSRDSSHCQPPTPFTCPQEKSWLIKHQSHCQGCTNSWVHSWIMCSLAAQGTSPSNTRCIPPASLPREASLSPSL